MNDQKIIDNAPEGATHYLVNQYDFTEGYFKLTEDCDVLVDGSEGWQEVDIDVSINGNYEVRNLADIKELVELRKANAELMKELKVTPKLQGVLDFLLGIGDIEGYDFSEGPEDQGPYWWRAHLREALKGNVI
jgi:hypothetical protein